MENPSEVFHEFGISIPKNLHITILEEREKELQIVIPPAPTNVESLSETDLVAQGGTGISLTIIIAASHFAHQC